MSRLPGQKLLISVGSAAAVAFGHMFDSINSVKADSPPPDSLTSQFNKHPTCIPAAAGVTWDRNWDKRAPKKATSEFGLSIPASPCYQSDQNLHSQAAKPRASRHLILVRHGEYNKKSSGDTERCLTDIGREQAKYAGIRLKRFGIHFDRIVQSSLIRATETAKIIKKELPSDIPVITCDLLNTGAPIIPVPESPWAEKVPPQNFYRDAARIEAAFRRWFHRADASQKKDSYEVIVCHSNVIRYFVCRALQLPLEAWRRLNVHYCSLTWLVIRPDGRVTAYIVGESQHLPCHLLQNH